MTPDHYKTGWRRIVAHLIDGITLRPLEWISAWVIASNLPMILKGTWLSVWSLSAVLYFIVLHALYGQTLGKKLLGVRLVKLSGERISWKQAILRESPILGLSLGFLILSSLHLEETMTFYTFAFAKGYEKTNASVPNTPFWMWFWIGGELTWALLEFITMFTNSKRRAIHDFLAGTVAVRVLPASSREHPDK